MENIPINGDPDHQNEQREKSCPNDRSTRTNIASSTNSIDSLESIEIVGIDSETHGRNCTSHMCCGHHVKVGDILVCTWQVQMISSEYPEEVVKILKIGSDGFPSCHVGYIPRRLFRKFDPKTFEKMFLKVEEDYRLSDNSHERHRSHHYHGMARCLVIHNNSRFNSRDCFNGEACILSENEGTSSSGKKKKKEKEKISLTDKEKLLAKCRKKSTRCKPIQFNPSPTKRGYTPVYQPRFPLSPEAITVVGVQPDDNSTVTYAGTIEVLQQETGSDIMEEDNTTVTETVTMVAALNVPKRTTVQKRKYGSLLGKTKKISQGFESDSDESNFTDNNNKSIDLSDDMDTKQSAHNRHNRHNPKRKSSFPILFDPSPRKWNTKVPPKKNDGSAKDDESDDSDVPIKLLFSNKK
jgi:hypothetical protein